METVRTFEQALALRFTHLKNKEQLSSEDIAAGARSLGFDWSRGKVWAIENLAKGAETAGTRRLTVSELLALPTIFERALRQRGAAMTFTLHDFLPTDDEVAVGVYVLPRGAAEAILRGSSFDFDRFEDQGLRAAQAASSQREQIVDKVAQQEVRERAPAISRATRGAVERSVAKKLGAPPELVAIASEQRWGESLTQHRNGLIPTEPPSELSGEEIRKWRSATRGHATREILNDAAFTDLVRTLVERYAHVLEETHDPYSVGGAYDPGLKVGSRYELCTSCQGTGRVAQDGDDAPPGDEICRQCRGAGIELLPRRAHERSDEG